MGCRKGLPEIAWQFRDKMNNPPLSMLRKFAQVVGFQ
jgi:hypothetical protein